MLAGSLLSHARSAGSSGTGTTDHTATGGAPTSFNASRFPHFYWRARVVSTSSGVIPPTTSFSFYVTPGQNSQSNGSGWSDRILFDNASVVKGHGSAEDAAMGY